jgi:regulator of protease activity HflC (stomatin/prohibitin superfamily)
MSVLRSLFSGLNYLAAGLRRFFGPMMLISVVGGIIYWFTVLPPVENVDVGVVALRINLLTGKLAQFYGPEKVIVLPGIHRLRRYPLYDQIYRATQNAKATGEAPLQSIEGLSLGAEITVRFAIEPDKLSRIARVLPQDINKELVEPLVEGTIYRIFSQHSVREIFSNKRQEIQEKIENELKPVLAVDGITLKAVLLGNIDLPKEYRAGLEKVLAEELKVEQMRYTLEINEKEIKQQELAAQARKVQTEVDAEANKIKRQKAAEAAANEEIIAAKAQAEAMQHILPFKQKQIEQRKLEAEANKITRLKEAEATAQAQRIEASGEADSRRKLAEADAYRAEVLGKTASEQMARDAALIKQNPLIIQKTLADKLADKISVIIAPPPESGGFIAAGLLGMGMPGTGASPKTSQSERENAPAADSSTEEAQ